MCIFVFSQSSAYKCLGACLVIIITCILILTIKQKRGILSVDNYTVIEEKFLFGLLAVWIFHIFSLPYALLVWIVFYLFVLTIKKNYHVIRCINLLYKKSCGAMLRNQLKIYQQLHSQIRGGSVIDTIKLICLKRRQITKKLLETNIKSNIYWTKSYISIHSFLLGLVIAGWGQILGGTSCEKMNAPFSVLIENNVVAFTIIYVFFPVANYLGIKCEKGVFVGQEVFFWVYYSLFAMVIFSIATIISFVGYY